MTSVADGWVLGGRYRVLDRIGTGGMAEVFRATDQLLDRNVAVKVFRSSHVANDQGNGADRRRLELQALARLNHPNLITLYDGNLDETPPYLVMELIDGPSLAARIAEGPVPEPVVRQIGAQLADGLAYVHAQGMVHRDVKPENILLGVDRSDEDSAFRARLSDFGIVRLLGAERMTSADFTLGTASYLAPEQARGSGVDTAADVYSLALVLLEALTGQRAFEGGTPLEAAMKRLSQRPMIPANLPAPWPALLYAMTDSDPASRPTAAQVARTLRAGPTDTTTFIPLAAGAASAAAATTVLGGAVPAAAAGGAALPPVAPRPVDAEFVAPPPEEPRRNGLLITGGVFALIIIIAGVIIAIILSSSGSGGSGSPKTSTSVSAPPSKSSSKASTSAKASKSTTSSSSAAPSTTHSTSQSTSSAPTTSSASTSTSASSSTTSSSNPPSSSTSTSTPPSSSTSKPASSSSSPAAGAGGGAAGSGGNAAPAPVLTASPTP